MKVRKVIRLVARGVGLAALFILVLEVCARIDDWATWGAPPWGHYSRELLTVQDELGTRGRPNGWFEKWRLNSHGFRGPEISMQKPDGVIRIAVMGASETFGLYESPGKEFPAQLQTMLEGARPGRYQVINAACAGMSLPRIAHYFRVWVGKFDPDVVIIYPTPASYLTNEAPRSKINVRHGPPVKPPESLRLARKVRIILKRALPARVRDRLRERRISRTIRRHKPDWVWQNLPPERVALFRRHLTELIDTVRDAGPRVVLATHANRFPQDRGKWTKADEIQMTAWRRFHPRATEPVLLSMERAGNQALFELGEQHGIPVVDLAEIVPGSRRVLTNLAHAMGLTWMKPVEMNQFGDFAHFTDSGAQVAAFALARQILELRLEEATAPPQR